MKVIHLHHKENEIIELAVAQNRQAQQFIYTKFSPKMLSVCRQYIKDIQQAEDVMIASFMKVFVHLNKFGFKGSFEGWIRRIVINECISHLRVHKKVTFLDDEIEYFDYTNDLEAVISVEDIQILIDSLPDGYKMIFNLFVIDGFKHIEIANMLGISEGTSKSQLAQARKILQKQLNTLKINSNGTK